MSEKIIVGFFLFIVYSIIGWILEEIYVYARKKTIANRGFFIGPYCPIYGIGCILIILLLSGFKKYPLLVFILAMVICTILEYSTSFIMEKLFKARWWDYSSAKYNINGRVCADTMIPFGLIACFVIYVLNPAVMAVVNNIPFNRLTILVIILMNY